MPDGRSSLFTTVLGTNRNAFGWKEWGLFATSGVGFGSAFVFIALALETMNPGSITTLRAATGAAAIYLFPQARQRIERGDGGKLFVLSMFLVAIPLTLVPIAQQWVSSAVVGMLGGAMPIMATVVSAFLLGAAPHRNQALGVGLGFVGVVLVCLDSFRLGDARAAWGVIAVLAATVCYAIALNIAAPLQRKYGSAPIMAPCLLIAAVLTAPYAWLTVGDSTFAIEGLAAITLVGVLGTGLANVALGTLVGRAGSARASIVAYLVPVVAIVLGVAVRGEVVTMIELIGVAVILVGAFMTSRAES